MLEQARERTGRFQRRQAEEGIAVAAPIDESSIAWLGGRIGDSIGVANSGCGQKAVYPREILMAGG